MDMGTIKKKLDQNVYTCAQECVDDFRTMFRNCCTYNKPTDVSGCVVTSRIRFIALASPVPQDVVMMSQSIEKLFEQKLQTMPQEVMQLCIFVVGTEPIYFLSCVLCGCQEYEITPGQKGRKGGAKGAGRKPKAAGKAVSLLLPAYQFKCPSPPPPCHSC